jgi:hypothetical protein
VERSTEIAFYVLLSTFYVNTPGTNVLRGFDVKRIT